jgi:hypothetical protein
VLIIYVFNGTPLEVKTSDTDIQIFPPETFRERNNFRPFVLRRSEKIANLEPSSGLTFSGPLGKWAEVNPSPLQRFWSLLGIEDFEEPTEGMLSVVLVLQF